MKRIFSFLGALALLAAGCKNPVENVEPNLNLNVFNNTVYIEFSDAANARLIADGTPMKVTIGGVDGQHIYNIAGKRDFEVSNGGVFVGLDPAIVPSDAAPVRFTVKVQAQGYLSEAQEIILGSGEKNKRVNLALVNLSAPPPNTTLSVKDFILQNGKMTNNGSVKARTTADSVYYDDGNTSVVLPNGTGFYYYESVQTGEAVGTRTVHYYKQSQSTYSLNGSTQSATVYIPADSLETYTYPVFEYQKKSYTGTQLSVICQYRNGNSVDYALYDESYAAFYEGNIPEYELLDGTSASADRLLYKTAVQKILMDLRFEGEITNAQGQKEKIYLTPENESKWFTSYNLNPAVINPVTSQPIQADDSIEVGVDPETHKTIRTVIKAAANGQLRVECRSLEVGYFYEAPFTYNYNYDFDGVKPSSIPDHENLMANAEVDFGVFKMGIYIDGMTHSAGTVVAKDPITQNQAKIFVNYCGKQLASAAVQQGQVQVYQASFLQQLPAPVNFHFSIKCENKNLVFSPSYYATAYESTGKLFYCNIISGNWSTRGLQAGQQYVFDGMVGGYHMRDTVILGATNEIYKVLKGDEDVCKNF